MVTFVAAQPGHIAEHNRIAAESLGRFSVNGFVIGDGIADDTSAFQSRIDACAAAGGGVVEAYAATFSVSVLTLKSNVHINLAGGTIKSRFAGAQGVVTTPITTHVENASIRNGVFDLNETAFGGVYINNATNITIDDNRFINLRYPYSCGIWLHENTLGCKVRGNFVTVPPDQSNATLGDIIMFGINVEGGGETSAGASTNDTMTFTEPVNLAQRHIITGNTITGGTHCISLTKGAVSCVVSGNYVNGASHRGIVVGARSTDNTVSGNVVENFISTGIHVSLGSDRCTVTGNTLKTTRSGIEANGINAIYGVRDITITGNVIHGVDGPGGQGIKGGGIRLAASMSGGVVVGNVITGCLNGVVVWGRMGGTYIQWADPPDMVGIVIANNLINAQGVPNATAVTLNPNDGVAITDVVNINNVFIP